MTVESHEFEVSTKGHNEVLDLTPAVARRLASGRVRDGIALVFVIGSTAGITTTEFGPGRAASIRRFVALLSLVVAGTYVGYRRPRRSIGCLF